MDILEQKHQSVKEARVYTSVAKMLQKVVDSCSNMAAYDILNQDASQVEGHHGVKIEGKQLRINFPRTPDSIQTNQKGKNADVHNQEVRILSNQHWHLNVITLKTMYTHIQDDARINPFMVRVEFFNLNMMVSLHRQIVFLVYCYAFFIEQQLIVALTAIEINIKFVV